MIDMPALHPVRIKVIAKFSNRIDYFAAPIGSLKWKIDDFSRHRGEG